MTAVPGIPDALVAGDSWTWFDPTVAAFPPPDWSLQYVLRPVAGGAAVTVTAEADGTLTVAATETAALAPGAYDWSALVTNATTGDRQRTAFGRLTVLPDPVQDSGDRRSPAERILAAIDATIEGRVTKDAESYSIEGRSISRTPMADLLRLRALYQRQVAAERVPGASPIAYRRIAL